MKPVDLRNETWEQARGRIGKDMQRVWDAVRNHGPGTTRKIAEAACISLLTLRPRVTDLFQLYLVELVDKDGTEGVYRAREFAEAEAAYNQERLRLTVEQGQPRQEELKLE